MRVLLCPLSDGGYLYPALAAGRELRRRGHHVDVLGRAAAAPFVAEAGLPFAAAEDFGGRGAFSVARWGPGGAAQFRAIRRAAREVRAEVLVTSVLCNGALLAAEVLDLPVVVVGLSVHLWDYAAGGAGEPQLGRSRENRTRESLNLYADVREEAGLGARAARWADGPLLGDALLLRGDPALEYPGAALPDRVRHVGPLAWEPTPDRAEVEEVRERLAQCAKPVVYVHLGRFFGGDSLWPLLNRAFTGGRFQAVVEQGRSTEPRPAAGADLVLVRRPWMGPFLDRADVVLTNGTSAPVLKALLHDRPLVVSPNGAEQPLLAGACLRAGVAVHVGDVASVDPQPLLETAWRDEGLRARARALGRRLTASDSAARAADVVEQVARTGRPDTRLQTSALPKEEDHGFAIGRPRA